MSPVIENALAYLETDKQEKDLLNVCSTLASKVELAGVGGVAGVASEMGITNPTVIAFVTAIAASVTPENQQ